MSIVEKLCLALLLSGSIVTTLATYTKIVELEETVVAPIKKEALGDYQLMVEQDSIVMWDADRVVGVLPLSYDADALSTMIIEDNE